MLHIWYGLNAVDMAFSYFSECSPSPHTQQRLRFVLKVKSSVSMRAFAILLRGERQER